MSIAIGFVILKKSRLFGSFILSRVIGDLPQVFLALLRVEESPAVVRGGSDDLCLESFEGVALLGSMKRRTISLIKLNFGMRFHVVLINIISIDAKIRQISFLTARLILSYGEHVASRLNLPSSIGLCTFLVVILVTLGLPFIFQTIFIFFSQL